MPEILKRSRIHQEGISVIEILVVVSVLGFALVGLLGLVVSSLNLSNKSRDNLEAGALAQDALEALRSFKENVAWDNDDPNNFYDGLGVLPVLTDLNVSLSGGDPVQWQIVSGSETFGRFSRRLVLERVSRDPVSKNIENVYNAPNDDPDTRKATVFVSWNSRQVGVSTYFTNWGQ